MRVFESLGVISEVVSMTLIQIDNHDILLDMITMTTAALIIPQSTRKREREKK